MYSKLLSDISSRQDLAPQSTSVRLSGPGY